MKETEITQISHIQDYLKEKILLDNFRKNAGLEKIPIIDIATGRFLEIICLVANPKTVLEIGCGSGFSSYFLIKNLKDGYYTGIDLNKDRIKKAKEFIRSKFPKKQVRFKAGNALNIIPALKGKFDLVFIDAAKYEYPLYIKTLKNKLRSEALIIADNIFYRNKIFKKVIDKHDFNSVKGIKEYVRYVTEDSCFSTCFIDVGDGISVTKFLEK